MDDDAVYCLLSAPQGRTEALLLSQSSDHLRLLDKGMKTIRESDPNPILNEWKVTGASIGASGILAQFERDDRQFLAVLDAQSLDFRRILVADNDTGFGVSLASVTCDSYGRVFSKNASALYLLESSGSPPTKWREAPD